MNIYVRDIVEKCSGTLLIGDEKIVLDNFSKDTRTLHKNDIYVGIKGDVFDGNILYKEALTKGAKGCILNTNTAIDQEFIAKFNNIFIVLVPDTVHCLQELARYKRSLYNIPVVAVTGSVGKTSTKDIIASVLGKKFNVLKTEGNYNNHIGVPLTLLKLKDHDALVIELGMNNLGEISFLSKLVSPTVAVITNVGTAHIGRLKSRENILKAKLEILDGMDKNGFLVINNDNDLLHAWNNECKVNNVITFGLSEPSNYMANNINMESLSSTYNVRIDSKDYEFNINVPGMHFVLNGLCALSVGRLYNIDIDNIKEAINNFVLTKSRMEIEVIKNVTIINDCYNANLDSMKSAINYLGTLSNVRKIAILGDMLELGEYEEEFHRQIGSILNDNKIDIIITVGTACKHTCNEIIKLRNNSENVYNFCNNEEAISKVKEIMRSNDAFLIKASNGMKFIEIYNAIKDTLQ